MNLIQCYMTANDCYKAGRTITPKGVMVHSTGANNPLIARYVQPVEGQANEAKLKAQIGTNHNANDWNNPGLDVCAHAFVGKLADGSVGTVQTLPWNRRGWHAGSGSKGTANNTHISFEICEDGLTDATYFNKVYQEAVQLTAMLCKTYNLNPLADGVVICHSEGHTRGIASNHGDVMHWFPRFNKSMDTFRSDVSKAMRTTTSKPTTGTNTGTLYRVQVGAYSVKSNADAQQAKVKSKGFDTYMVQAGGMYKIQVGAYSNRSNAEAMLAKVKAAGFQAYITTTGGQGVSATPTFTPYTVKVSVTELRIRSGPGTDTAALGLIKPGVYTIVGESDGPGASKWGRLKSGEGWISLDYTE